MLTCYTIFYITCIILEKCRSFNLVLFLKLPHTTTPPPLLCRLPISGASPPTRCGAGCPLWLVVSPLWPPFWLVAAFGLSALWLVGRRIVCRRFGCRRFGCRRFGHQVRASVPSLVSPSPLRSPLRPPLLSPLRSPLQPQLLLLLPTLNT